MTIYISAYYHIPKPRSPHMGIARYVKTAPEMLSMISGSHLIFFYEESFVGTLFERLSENLGVKITAVRKPLNELPMRHEAIHIAAAAKRPDNPEWARLGKEKGQSHLPAVGVAGARNEYRDNLKIWLSKITLVAQVAEELAGECPLCWVDAGIAKKNFTRSNWDFTKIEEKRGRLVHYSSEMRHLGKRLPLNASFLKAGREEWADINKLYIKKVAQLRSDGYPHDEETVLGQVVRENPDLFQCIGRPYAGPFRNFQYYVNRFSGRKIRQ